MSSLIPRDYRYKISSPTPVDKEPKKVANEKNLASFPQNNSFCKYNNYIIIRLSN
jgi:hypothetical protein